MAQCYHREMVMRSILKNSNREAGENGKSLSSSTKSLSDHNFSATEQLAQGALPLLPDDHFGEEEPLALPFNPFEFSWSRHDSRNN